MARDSLSLQEAAERLGVHYMTVYRYVRLGRLPATMRRGQWVVRPADVDAFASSARRKQTRVRRGKPRWSEYRSRLRRRLVAGDATGAWALVEQALVSGAEPVDIYVDLLAPVLRQIGVAWEKGTVSVAEEHQATVAARRVMGRLGMRFARRGRTRGTVVLGGVHGDRHELPLAMVADVLRGAGYDVIDLGTNTPAASFVEAASRQVHLIAIGVSIGSSETLAEAQRTVATLHRTQTGIPILVGGPAVHDAAHAEQLGADGFAPDARATVDQLVALTAAPRG